MPMDLAEVTPAAQRLRIAAARAASQWPTPFYLLDLDAIVSRAEQDLREWVSMFKNARLAYSYKTNALRVITSRLAKLGYAAETVSAAEVSFAVDDAVATGVFLGGPTLNAVDFTAGIEADAVIKVDSLAQLDNALVVAKRHRRRLDCVLRLALHRNGRWSRFGLLPEEVFVAIDRAGTEDVNFIGVHFHPGSNIVDCGTYARSALSCLTAVQLLLARNPDRPVMVSIGGGFPSKSWKSAGSPPTLSKIGGDVREALAPHIDLDHLELVAEPGRSLVEDHGALVTRAVAVKSRPEGRCLFVDGGTNLVNTLHLWNHPVEIIWDKEEVVDIAKYDVYGSQCFEADRFAEQVDGPLYIAPGAIVVVYQAGAYDLNGASLWTRSGPAVIAVRGGEFREARDRYDVNMIRGSVEFPAISVSAPSNSPSGPALGGPASNHGLTSFPD